MSTAPEAFVIALILVVAGFLIIYRLVRGPRIGTCNVCDGAIYDVEDQEWHRSGECMRATDQMNEEYGDD